MWINRAVGEWVVAKVIQESPIELGAMGQALWTPKGGPGGPLPSKH